MKKIFILTTLFSAFAIAVSAQRQLQLTPSAQVSVLTISPGNELVDSFGHSAFRVRDPLLSVDYVYNYGTYDFNTPNFYGKFAQGKLRYDLSMGRYALFLNSYAAQNRTVVEQILNLTKEEKQHFFEFLQNNARPENKSYLYDFFFDNCATKLHDVSQEILTEKIQFNYTFNETDLTFRQLIHSYLDRQPWGKFGIDLALGSVIDRKATPKEYLFLPDYIFQTFEKGTINGKPLVRITRTLFEAFPVKQKKTFFTPFILFAVLAIVVLLITYRDFKQKKRSRWLDVTLFLFTGIIGVLVLLLWFATDHSATQQNYNMLWAAAPNVLIAFFLLNKQLKSWLKNYVRFLVGLLLMTAALWVLKIQVFSLALIPFLLVLMLRYIYLIAVMRTD